MFLNFSNSISEGAVLVIREKVLLTKNFDIKTRYIRNNNGLPIPTLEFEGKQSDGTRNMTNINFALKEFQGILSSHKISEKYNEKECSIKKLYLNISQYSRKNTHVGVSF